MRPIPVIFFVIFLSSCFEAVESHAQPVIEGAVINTDSGNPLEGAHVYLSGTKVGTATDYNGQYRLGDVPIGGHRMVVSMIGFGTKIIDIVIGPGDSQIIKVELEEVIYELPEIRIGNQNKKWRKRLQRFTHHFIGESDWADSVEIINPEVLRFDEKWWGKISAEAKAPLRIKNHALGYDIIYHLEDFSHSGGRTRWDGEPLFREMKPVDSVQAAYWEENRKKAFYGSLRHFLLSLLGDRVKEEGYRMYIYRQGVNGYSSDGSRISARQMIDRTDEPYLHTLQFIGRLEIVYLEEGEAPGYLRWKQEYRNRRPGTMQRSYLQLNEHPVTVDEDGEIIQPYGATQFGYFAYERLAHLTPRLYRPSDYHYISTDVRSD